MDLNTLWFALIAILFTGYFVLDGFDLGVGILLPFLGKKDIDRRVILNTIGPHWDGNEVWLITAGGAMFAAVPNWYATLFSGFYLALFLMLLALILRGVALEFRSKDENPTWRKLWDWAVFIGSLLPALLWGVAFANFVRGVPINAEKIFVGNFWDLINLYAILGGLVSLAIFTLQGAIFLSLKTEEPIREKAEITAKRLWIPAFILLVLTIAATYFLSDIPDRLGINLTVLPFLILLAGGLTLWFITKRRMGRAFIANSVTILLGMVNLFAILYPRVMVSILDPNFSLTIYNSASGVNTLRIMSIVAAIFVPVVLVYQGWSYWIFRKRVTTKAEDLHY